MKKLILFLGIVSSVFLNGCEKEDTDLKACEIANIGTLVIINDTGQKVWVAFTYNLTDEPDWSYAYPGYRTYYRDINAGKLYVWILFDEHDYKNYKEINLKACSYLQFKWK